MLEGLDLTEEDKKFISICSENKNKLTPPIYSNFRVYALLTYEDEGGKLQYVTGANCESCFIGGSICAERSAIVKFREIKYKRFFKLYLVSDADRYITPGILCRQFLLEYLSPTTPVIMIGAKESRISDLATLYPHPPHYLGVNGLKVVEAAKAFSASVEDFKHKYHSSSSSSPSSPPSSSSSYSPHLVPLFESVVRATSRDSKDSLFPLRMAAGLLIEDKETHEILFKKITWQDKTLEYGSTIDPITKLLALLQEYLYNEEQKHKHSQSHDHHKRPHQMYLIQSDQFGVLHPPVAQARALYFENDFGGIIIIVHNKEGKLVDTNFVELLPDSPKVDVFLDEIRQSFG